MQVAPLWFTVPPKKYGGTERIVSYLCDGLVKRGHKVTLFASPGSKTSAKLVSIYSKPLISAGLSWKSKIPTLNNLSQAYEMAIKENFDLIHVHTDVWSLFFNNLTKIPTVHTMHNPLYSTQEKGKLKKYERYALFKDYSSKTNIVFISKASERNARLKAKRSVVIHNSIDTDNFPFSPTPKDHFIWIARISQNKGIENAIEAAEITGAKLLLAGRLDPDQINYFEEKIKPRLSNKICYLGELKRQDLPKFYGSAKALLYPIEWEEPFGLVVVEAMASGTPVIAYKRGSMLELIENGKTGFIVENMREFTEAMKKIDTLDRRYIYERSRAQWSVDRMVDDYENFYYKIICG